MIAITSMVQTVVIFIYENVQDAKVESLESRLIDLPAICLQNWNPSLKTPLREPSGTPKSLVSRTSNWELDVNGVWSSSKLILRN